MRQRIAGGFGLFCRSIVCTGILSTSRVGCVEGAFLPLHIVLRIFSFCHLNSLVIKLICVYCGSVLCFYFRGEPEGGKPGGHVWVVSVLGVRFL